ncbi:hypothetical protein ACOMHN_016649 [Nucella lapillus]
MEASEQKDNVQEPPSPASDSVPACLREGDHSTDLVFTVEGQRLHFSKAVLTMCSPVFQSLLTPDFVQRHSEGIPLKGKTYRAVAFFLTQLHPVFSPVTPMTDDLLLEILALAKEYQVDHVSTKCEQYIGSQLQLHNLNVMLTTDALLIYLTTCERYHLAKHRDRLVELAANQAKKELQQSKVFESVPATTLREVFFSHSQILESSIAKAEGDLSSLKYSIKNGLKEVHNLMRISVGQFPSGDLEYSKNILTEGIAKVDTLMKSLLYSL